MPTSLSSSAAVRRCHGHGYRCATSVERYAPYHHALSFFRYPPTSAGEVGKMLQPIHVARIEAVARQHAAPRVWASSMLVDSIGRSESA